MDLKDIVAISGMGGLFKVNVRRPDGLIVTSFDEDRAKFVSNRVHIFTPLDGITLYTIQDNIELAKVLLEMKKQQAKNAPLDPKESNDNHKTYFKKIVADFDDERVYVSDIKKVIKWFHLLDAKGLITEPVAAEPVNAAKETAEEKPAKKAPKSKATAADTTEGETPKAKKAAKPKK